MNIEKLFQIAARKGRVYPEDGVDHRLILDADGGGPAYLLVRHLLSQSEKTGAELAARVHETPEEASAANTRNRMIVNMQAALWACTDAQLAAVGQAMTAPGDDGEGKNLVAYAMLRDRARCLLKEADRAKVAADEAAVEARTRIAACEAREKDLAIRERAVAQQEEAVRRQWERVAGPYSTGIDEAIAVGRVVLHLARVAGGVGGGEDE